MSDLLCTVGMFLWIWSDLQYMWSHAHVLCIRLSLCSTYIKCGQECVSVFSLVNVVKRGLISSNVIHTVTSHYFQSAWSPPHSLYPSLPSFLPFSPFFSLFCPFYVTLISLYALSAPHQKNHNLLLVVSTPPRLPSFLLMFFFFSTVTHSHPHITFHHISISQHIEYYCTFPMVDILNFLVFTPRAWSHQQN